MDIVRMVFTVILMVTSVLMIVVVLMQKSSEGGLGAAFGGDSGSVSSSKGRAASKEAKLQKITKILGIVMGVLALVVVVLP